MCVFLFGQRKTQKAQCGKMGAIGNTADFYRPNEILTFADGPIKLFRCIPLPLILGAIGSLFGKIH